MASRFSALRIPCPKMLAAVVTVVVCKKQRLLNRMMGSHVVVQTHLSSIKSYTRT